MYHVIGHYGMSRAVYLMVEDKGETWAVQDLTTTRRWICRQCAQWGCAVQMAQDWLHHYAGQAPLPRSYRGMYRMYLRSRWHNLDLSNAIPVQVKVYNDGAFDLYWPDGQSRGHLLDHVVGGQRAQDIEAHIQAGTINHEWEFEQWNKIKA